MELILHGISKQEIFKEIEDYLMGLNLKILSKDDTRPWGGFFVIDENESVKFGKNFFPEYDIDNLRIAGKLSPKILAVEPHKRLSWQYHHRRAEIWRVIAGTAGVITGNTDIEGELKNYSSNQLITLACGIRHRLVGLNNWAVIAEIWQHTDAGNPSDEDDIVRLQDDFGR
ncbi:MAG: phosphoheptose isomerase [Ignavibacteria bacterium]|nr:phosphoheptose isomerase [Ignavibacteria bacterium]